METGLYTLDSNGNITSPVTMIVNVKGDKASEGKVCITTQGSVGAYSLKVGKYYVTSLDGKTQEITDGIQDLDCSSTGSGTGESGESGGTGESGESGGTGENAGSSNGSIVNDSITSLPLPENLVKGTIVYFNPETKTICESTQAVSTTGTKTGCMKWYVYKNNGNGTYQLILDHNTTFKIKWSSEGTTTAGMKEVATQLASDIATWDRSLNARLITANEVAEITGKTPFDVSTSAADWYYLENNSQTRPNTSNYGWLSDNLQSSWGYWTSTPYFKDNTQAWIILKNGEVSYLVWDNVNFPNSGIRPVITV